MKHRSSHFIKSFACLSLVSAFFIQGCGREKDEPSLLRTDDVGTVVTGPVRPIKVDQGSLTVFSEAGFWGTQYATSLPVLSSKENYVYIPSFTLKSKNLLNAISSARLSCGTRAMDVFFLDGADGGTTTANWQSHVLEASCSPGQSVDCLLYTSDAADE